MTIISMLNYVSNSEKMPILRSNPDLGSNFGYRIKFYCKICEEIKLIR